MKKNIKKTTKKINEVEKFDLIAQDWWNKSGELSSLHKINPARFQYIEEQIKKHFNKTNIISALDIGCGGGLISEPLAQLGVNVTAIDASEKSIKIAKTHAKKQKLKIDYKCSLIEDMPKSKKYDVITALEIIEHIDNPEIFIKNCKKLLKPNGILIISTLNRTHKSFLLGIMAAEYILKLVPKGTHDWRSFYKPSELSNLLEKESLELTDITGIKYNALSNNFLLSKKDLSINYIVTAIKQ